MRIYYPLFSLVSTVIHRSNKIAIISLNSKSKDLNHSFIQKLIANMNQVNSSFLLLVEVEAQHIPCRKTIVIKILADLFLALGIVARAAPDLQLDDILLPQIIDDHIGSGLISGLCFDIIVSCAVDNRLQIQQELLSSVLLFETGPSADRRPVYMSQ